MSGPKHPPVSKASGAVASKSTVKSNNDLSTTTTTSSSLTSLSSSSFFFFISFFTPLLFSAYSSFFTFNQWESTFWELSLNLNNQSNNNDKENFITSCIQGEVFNTQCVVDIFQQKSINGVYEPVSYILRGFLSHQVGHTLTAGELHKIALAFHFCSTLLFYCITVLVLNHLKVDEKEDQRNRDDDKSDQELKEFNSSTNGSRADMKGKKNAPSFSTLLVQERSRLHHTGAFLVSLFWSLHPLCVEVIGWGASFSYVLVTFLLFLTFYIYLYHLIHHNHGSYAFSLLSFWLFVVAVFTHLSALSFPFILMVVDIFLKPHLNIHQAGNSSSLSTTSSIQPQKHWFLYLFIQPFFSIFHHFSFIMISGLGLLFQLQSDADLVTFISENNLLLPPLSLSSLSISTILHTVYYYYYLYIQHSNIWFKCYTVVYTLASYVELLFLDPLLSFLQTTLPQINYLKHDSLLRLFILTPQASQNSIFTAAVANNNATSILTSEQQLDSITQHFFQSELLRQISILFVLFLVLAYVLAVFLQKSPLFITCLSSFFICFFPVSGFLGHLPYSSATSAGVTSGESLPYPAAFPHTSPAATFIASRYIYWGSSFFFLLIACWASQITRKILTSTETASKKTTTSSTSNTLVKTHRPTLFSLVLSVFIICSVFLFAFHVTPRYLSTFHNFETICQHTLKTDDHVLPCHEILGVRHYQVASDAPSTQASSTTDEHAMVNPTAFRHLQRAYELRTNSLIVISLYAQLYADSGHSQKALDILQHILASETDSASSPPTKVKQVATSSYLNNPFVWMSIGRIQYQAESYHDAIRSFEKVISLSPQYIDAFYYLAMTHEKLGDHLMSQSYHTQSKQIMKQLAAKQKRQQQQLKTNKAQANQGGADSQVVVESTQGLADLLDGEEF